MEIKDIVVEADMNVRGGAGDALNVVGNLSQSVSGHNRVSGGGIADQISQGLSQEVAFAPVIGQQATAAYTTSASFGLDVKDLNVQFGGFFGPRRLVK